MAIISEEMKVEILAWLPVKSLMRFKSVCKPWCSLFSDPAFVKMHREYAIRRGTSDFLMFHYKLNSTPMNPFYSVNYNSLSSRLSSSSRGNPLRDSIEMDYPLMPPDYLKLLGSCFGLLCLRTSEPGDEDFICLWNPSTRECKNLPASPNHFRSSCEGMDIVLCGLGYDHKDNDFKVVRVAEIDSSAESFDNSVKGSEVEVYTFRPNTDQAEVSTIRSYSVFEIYSLRSNSWKKCQTVPYYFPGELKSGVLVNGALHWLAIKRHDGNEAIISFDFSDEVFMEVAILDGPMKHPPGSDTEDENNQVGMLGGCICVLHKTYYKVHVWVMQEYGVKESWTKHVTITNECIVETSVLRVVCDFQNGGILFSTDDSLVYYDPNRTRGTRVLGTDRLKGAEKCMASIVSLDSSTYCLDANRNEQASCNL